MTPRRPPLRSGTAALVLCAVLCAVLGGCGVPTGGAPAAIAPADLPTALTSGTPGSTTSAAPSPAVGQPLVFLVDAEDVLVPRGRSVRGDTREQVEALLESLADGPTQAERREGLISALSAQVGLTVRDLSGGTVTVELAGGTDTATGLQSRRAVAQVVLTATSLPDVDGVLLTQDGTAVEAPLPTGALTTRPLTAADYAGYLTGPP